MASSVSVDDNLRKKIKKIAAELDTSQGKVIERGIELLELELMETKYDKDHPAREILRKAGEKRKSVKWRQEIRKKLQAPGVPIDQVIISQWSVLNED